MKSKELALSIILNAFLGYLWIVFIDHIVSVANSMENTFIVGGLLILIGTALFWEIVNRVTPFNEYKITHPVKLAGVISFGLVVFVNFFVLNLI
ncbi:hypothetical protein J3A84_04510 [Proteiniclasticum sp. SCR006]|uniref:Uncharacterized protein n=1 Tax=Proteiniclasticum aestuarii TaxID=2817862 RepID=A0A939KIS8_9CLOT|nr:hypothetical protein [Proteiniclasticum aestuarii]MBO1264301.1 hypothetical protein [Proteiniclasticum aestuarii]